MRSIFKLVLFQSALLAGVWAQAQSIQYPVTAPTFYSGDSVSFAPALVNFPSGQDPQCVATGLPSGMVINPATCAILGVAPNSGPVGQVFQVNVMSPLAPMVNLSITVLANAIVYPSTSLMIYSGDQVLLIPRLVGFTGTLPASCTAFGLPSGLTINPTTCTISGVVGSVPPGGLIVRPTVTSPRAAPVNMMFRVAQSGIAFDKSQYVLYSNDRVQIIPRIVGFVDGRSPNCVASGLPPGLLINSNTCMISGVLPVYTAPSPTLYNVNITAVGVTPTALKFQLLANGVIYPTNKPVFYARNRVFFVPQLVGYDDGQLPSCAASGLPSGLMMDPMSCIISGIPAMSAGPGSLFFVSITGPGLAPQSLEMQVLANDIIYPTLHLVVREGERVSLVPTLVGFQGVAGGPNCSATGLPPGLQVDPFTCAITGIAGAVPSPGVQFNVGVSSPGLAPYSLQITVMD